MRKHILIVGSMFLIAAIGFFIWLAWPDTARLSVDAVAGRIPQLGAPRAQTIPTMDVAKAVGWPQGAQPTPARGLAVNAFATGLDHPRWLYRLPNGDVLVAETNSPKREVSGITGLVMGHLMDRAGAGGASPNRILLLRDTNGDGTADLRETFLTGLNSPFGMAVMGDWLYVADTDALLRFPYRPGDTKITAKPEKIVPLPGGGNHWARNVVAAPDGKSLFVSVGSSSNIAENGLDAEGPTYTAQSPAQIAQAATKSARAAILQVDPDRKRLSIYAWGLRNPVGMAFEPHSNTLWTVVNERDMLGSDLPPDYLTQVDFGGFYGWPWNYWGGHVDKRVTPERPDLLEYTVRPDFALGAHVAPLGLTFATGAKLGPQYSDGAFIGEHGSWNRKPPSGYKVVYVPFGANGFPLPNAKPQDVLTGFLDAKGQAMGRPVGVIVDASGALLVADDVGNAIWRVTGR